MTGFEPAAFTSRTSRAAKTGIDRFHFIQNFQKDSGHAHFGFDWLHQCKILSPWIENNGRLSLQIDGNLFDLTAESERQFVSEVHCRANVFADIQTFSE